MIGVVGSGPDARQIVRAIDDAGESAVVDDAEAVADASPTAIVAVGDAGLVEVAGADVGAPVLPVGVDGLPGPAVDDAAEAIDRTIAGAFRTRSLPLLDVGRDGKPVGTAVFDVMLDTAEPGRISEYSVEAGESSDRFRADGVVVATPAGSRGYAKAAGGPVLDDGVHGVGVVPVAAFELGADPRVVEPPVTLTVERDECPVSLLVDGRERDGIEPGRPVEVAGGGALEIVESRPGLEKL